MLSGGSLASSSVTCAANTVTVQVPLVAVGCWIQHESRRSARCRSRVRARGAAADRAPRRADRDGLGEGDRVSESSATIAAPAAGDVEATLGARSPLLRGFGGRRRSRRVASVSVRRPLRESRAVVFDRVAAPLPSVIGCGAVPDQIGDTGAASASGNRRHSSRSAASGRGDLAPGSAQMVVPIASGAAKGWHRRSRPGPSGTR